MFTTYYKYAGVVIIVIGLIASFYVVIDRAETKGYNRAITEMQELSNAKIKKVTEEAISKATKNMQKAIKRQRLLFDKELIREKSKRIVEVKVKEIIKYVDKIKINDNCNVVDNSVIELLNSSINNSNTTSN